MAVQEPGLRISVDDYLRQIFRPDREYIDGCLRERNMGEYDHSTIQGILVRLLGNRDGEWGTRTRPELRVQVSNDRYHVPDVCVLSSDAPKEQIVTRPPLVCIEVLSPDDTLGGLMDRAVDYRDMGVRDVWLIDPARRRAYVFGESGLQPFGGSTLTVAGSPISLNLADVFEALD